MENDITSNGDWTDYGNTGYVPATEDVRLTVTPLARFRKATEEGAAEEIRRKNKEAMEAMGTVLE